LRAQGEAADGQTAKRTRVGRRSARAANDGALARRPFAGCGAADTLRPCRLL